MGLGRSELTPEERQQIEHAAQKYGAANCWTGTAGTLARYIVRLLEVIDAKK